MSTTEKKLQRFQNFLLASGATFVASIVLCIVGLKIPIWAPVYALFSSMLGIGVYAFLERKRNG